MGVCSSRTEEELRQLHQQQLFLLNQLTSNLAAVNNNAATTPNNVPSAIYMHPHASCSVCQHHQHQSTATTVATSPTSAAPAVLRGPDSIVFKIIAVNDTESDDSKPAERRGGGKKFMIKLDSNETSVEHKLKNSDSSSSPAKKPSDDEDSSARGPARRSVAKKQNVTPATVARSQSSNPVRRPNKPRVVIKSSKSPVNLDEMLSRQNVYNSNHFGDMYDSDRVDFAAETKRSLPLKRAVIEKKLPPAIIKSDEPAKVPSNIKKSQFTRHKQNYKRIEEYEEEIDEETKSNDNELDQLASNEYEYDYECLNDEVDDKSLLMYKSKKTSKKSNGQVVTSLHGVARKTDNYQAESSKFYEISINREDQTIKSGNVSVESKNKDTEPIVNPPNLVVQDSPVSSLQSSPKNKCQSMRPSARVNQPSEHQIRFIDEKEEETEEFVCSKHKKLLEQDLSVTVKSKANNTTTLLLSSSLSSSASYSSSATSESLSLLADTNYNNNTHLDETSSFLLDTMSLSKSPSPSTLREENAARLAGELRPTSSTPPSFTNQDKLKLQSIVEAVGFILFPSQGFINLAFKDLLHENGLLDGFQKLFKEEFKNLFECNDEASFRSQRFAPPSQDLINKCLLHLIDVQSNKIKQSEGSVARTQLTLKIMQKRLGYLYFKRLYDEFEKPLRSLAGTLASFYSNLNSLHESLISHPQFGPRFLYLNESYTGYTPSFRSEQLTNSQFNIYTVQECTSSFINNFYYGLIDASANLVWNLNIKVEKIRNRKASNAVATTNNQLTPYTLGYKITVLQQQIEPQQELSGRPDDLCIGLDVFKTTFPFNLVLDRELKIKQMGDSFLKYLGNLISSQNDFNFLTYFEIVQPKLNEYTFESLLLNHNMSYKLKMRPVVETTQFKEMELKGSMVYLKESDCLMFIGSPLIQRLEELTGRGLYISDIPIHDATRDIILVGEQTKAQEGLKFRMEKLKKSIVKAHEDIEEEKQKNIELLNLIFPSEIAKKLWRGERVQASSMTNVTLLYSDIVGFTSICSTSQPIEVIEMLKELYTEFDHYCGLIDVYKIETIGDAYLLAGNLHKPSDMHAQQIAWMSLIMIELAGRHVTPKGERIKMRVGLHTGDVLAGIVGIKQPRYCLFGNNCAVGNKFESMSVEQRIHVSPVTKRLLDVTEGFEFEPRSKDFLPENWFAASYSQPDDISWFLNSYKHKDLPVESDSCFEHVHAALKHHKLISPDTKFII